MLVGIREGLLPWSRETLATNSNHDAYLAIDTGDVDLAISHINRSLRNNPNQPEIVQMREDLLGQRSIYSDDGDVLTEVFERAFGASLEGAPAAAPASDPVSNLIEFEDFLLDDVGDERFFVEPGGIATGSQFAAIINARTINWWTRRMTGGSLPDPELATFFDDLDD